jgi:rhamnosyltransferase
MKIAAVVILYHPESTTVENILSYIHHVSKLYAVDNTEISDPSFIVSIRSRIPGTDYIHDGENAGIAKRLNQVCQKALAEGYDYILTMDQDSSFKPEVIDNYFECFNNYPDKHEVSMFGLQYEHPHWASMQCDAEPITQLITSGSLVNLAIFEKLGGFDEKLFIDTVDFEYCYRSIVNQFKVIRFRNVFLTHNLGTTGLQNATIVSRAKELRFHSPLRLYYMVRNYFYLRRKYAKYFPAEFAMSKKAILSRVKTNLLHGKNKFETLRFISRAVADYKRNSMGKYG